MALLQSNPPLATAVTTKTFNFAQPSFGLVVNNVKFEHLDRVEATVKAVLDEVVRGPFHMPLMRGIGKIVSPLA